MSGQPPLREFIAAELNNHHPTRGMAVTMGVTCACGYWTGNEPDRGKRPLPWGADQLDLHRADVVAGLVALVANIGAAQTAGAWDEGYREAIEDYGCDIPWGGTTSDHNPYRRATQDSGTGETGDTEGAQP